MLAGSNSDRSPLYDVRNLAAAAQWAAAAKRCFADEGVLALLLSASDRVDQTIWWSQTGSNRRPHACKARALPAELWPRNQKTNASRSQLILRSPSQSATAQQPSFKKACRAEAAKQRRLVGLGRLELPTSRLSSARSNQLSYKPQRSLSSTTDHQEAGQQLATQPGVKRPMQSHKRKAPGACSSAKKEKRRRRNPANGAQQS